MTEGDRKLMKQYVKECVPSLSFHSIVIINILYTVFAAAPMGGITKMAVKVSVTFFNTPAFLLL